MGRSWFFICCQKNACVRLLAASHQPNWRNGPISFNPAQQSVNSRLRGPAQLQGLTIHTIGYPTDKPEVRTRPKRKWMQWRAVGKVDNEPKHDRPGHDAYEFYHDADTSNGQSGSPMRIEEQDGKKP